MKHLKRLMEINYLKNTLPGFFIFFSILFIINCSSDESSEGNSSNANIAIIGAVAPFGEVNVLSFSDSQSIQVKGTELISNVSVSVSDNFEISLDDVSFSNSLVINRDLANSNGQTLYVRFSPSESALGSLNGFISLVSNSAVDRSISLNGIGLSISPTINSSNANINFEDTIVSQESSALTLLVSGDNLVSAIDVNVSEGFEISFDNSVYESALQIPFGNVSDDTIIYVRFTPISNGNVSGTIILSSIDADDVEVSLSGIGLALVHNYVAFDSERLAFGGGYSQSSTQTFNLHDDLTNVETIKMFVTLRCPTGGCDEWDVYANVKVRDDASGELYELGRYITPYWNDNSQLDRGFEFDVTDFKSLLSGSTELRIRTECWNDRGYEVTVDFDYIEGTPDFPYYAVSRVIAFDDWSSSGVPYGLSHSLDLDKSVAIPSNSESTHLRTIISGWGHATPNDSDGRGCAEWCYRTHDVMINGSSMFQHNLGPLGCASNPVSNQAPGNWQPDRAGWCPGMVVPVRNNEFGSTMAGSAFTFEYDYEDWINNEGNGNAYYATSTFVVVKSTTPISKPVVTD